MAADQPGDHPLLGIASWFFGAMIFMKQDSPLVEIGLSIASFTYGGTLGMFVTVRFFKKCNLWQYVVPFFFSIAVMTFVILAGWSGLFKVNWTWYTLIGVLSSVFMNRLLVWLGTPKTVS
ncbi:MAG: hypothetical protein U5N56_01000 [Candidatus Marinimicrobia bacterium]|nr:hypothetical protein [Candidatus Neomarinimicrobiota bacterium]